MISPRETDELSIHEVLESTGYSYTYGSKIRSKRKLQWILFDVIESIIIRENMSCVGIEMFYNALVDAYHDIDRPVMLNFDDSSLNDFTIDHGTGFFSDFHFNMIRPKLIEQYKDVSSLSVEDISKSTRVTPDDSIFQCLATIVNNPNTKTKLNLRLIKTLVSKSYSEAIRSLIGVYKTVIDMRMTIDRGDGLDKDIAFSDILYSAVATSLFFITINAN